MKRYLLIGSRDPFEHANVSNLYATAQGLKDEGHEVTLFLVENGVLPARRSPASEPLSALAKAGVTVVADGFSLRERGIADDRLAEGVAPAGMDVVIDGLEAGLTPIWH